MKARAPKPKKKPGCTMTQAQRRERGAKLIVSLTLSAEALADLDERRGLISRGEFIENLLTTEGDSW